jgi:hypothetical protein
MAKWYKAKDQSLSDNLVYLKHTAKKSLIPVYILLALHAGVTVYLLAKIGGAL